MLKWLRYYYIWFFILLNVLTKSYFFKYIYISFSAIHLELDTFFFLSFLLPNILKLWVGGRHCVNQVWMFKYMASNLQCHLDVVVKHSKTFFLLYLKALHQHGRPHDAFVNWRDLMSFTCKPSNIQIKNL